VSDSEYLFLISVLFNRSISFICCQARDLLSRIGRLFFFYQTLALGAVRKMHFYFHVYTVFLSPFVGVIVLPYCGFDVPPWHTDSR
jgi:hypothetical protein